MPQRSFVPFEPGSNAVVSVLGLVAVALAGIWWWTGRPEQVPVTSQRPPAVSPVGSDPLGVASPSAAVPTSSSAVAPLTAGPNGTPATATATGSAGAGDPVTGVPAGGATVTVDVRGAVRSPGLRELPAGSRVMDAVAAAGGLARGRAYGPVNLARVVTDGEQIRIGPSVPVAMQPGTASAGGTATAAPAAALIDINSASAEQLEELDGVGPVLAGTIVQWRTDNGPFQTVEDLLDVSGIGDATLAGMRDQVTVG